MYLRPVFNETDLDRILAMIAANPFGVLVTQGAGGMEASHIPFVIEHEGGKPALAAHLAAANPQCAALEGGTALAIFTGPHAYIAPGWYRTQPAVPTWDYVAVHVHGRLEPVADPSSILRALATDDPAHFALDALPDAYRASMLKGIRGFRLPLERVETQWKLSQNRSPEDRQAVIAALRQQGNQPVADLIEATLPAS